MATAKKKAAPAKKAEPVRKAAAAAKRVPAKKAVPKSKLPPSAAEFASAMQNESVHVAPGSGGPNDPANTALAHMSEHQRAEGQGPGNPTTGGVTPTLSGDQLSELQREQAAERAAAEKKTHHSSKPRR